MIMSGFTLVNNLHYFSFFGDKNIDIVIDKAPIRNRWGLAWERKDQKTT